MARTWLVALLTPMVCVACLFPEPADYERKLTPPFVWSPDPPTTEVLSVKSNETRQFNVLVKSEDAPGDDLWAFLYLNYLIQGRQELQPGIAVVPSATLSAEGRIIDMSWRVPVRPTPGTCEQLTLVVSHRSNFVGTLPEQPEDVAALTWWVNINASESSIGACPHGAIGATP